MRKIMVLDELDNRIIQLLKEGKEPKEISHTLNKNKNTIRTRMFRLRKFFGCYSNHDLKNYIEEQSPAA